MSSLTLPELKSKETDLVLELQDVRAEIVKMEAADTNPAPTSPARPDLASVDSFSIAYEPSTAESPPPASDGGEESSEPDHEGDVEAKILGWKAAGNKHFSAQNFDEAIEEYGRCIKVIKKIEKDEDKAYTAIYANRSAAHLATKKWVKASWDAQCAAKCDPTFWKAHWRHGVSLMAMAPRIERSTNAVKAFETCLPLAPEEKKAEVTEALERAKIRLQEGKDRTPMPPQCAQS